MRARSLVLPGDASTSLVRLGVPAWQWPNLKMRNRPVNQDGCKGATLKLSYLGYRVVVRVRVASRHAARGAIPLVVMVSVVLLAAGSATAYWAASG